MANLVVNRADLWPVGTVVNAVLGHGHRGATAESETVASDGTLTYTTLSDATPYTLYGTPSGAANPVILHLRKGDPFVPRSPWPWNAVVAARITARATDTLGVATLAAGTVTVNNAAIIAGATVLLTKQKGDNNAHVAVGTIVAGTSFVINSDDSADTSLVFWKIVSPGGA